MHRPQEHLRPHSASAANPGMPALRLDILECFCSMSRALTGPPSTAPRLFTYDNEQLFSKPTYAAIINLLNNYQRATGRGEHFTAQELAEQDTFLREIMKTAVMKELYGFLQQQSE